MKKHLIAAAVAAAVAVPAMAQVTIDGVIDVGYVSRHIAGQGTIGEVTSENGTKVRSNSVSNSHMVATPTINFRGTEDLGNGLKARFVLSREFQPDDGTEANKDGFTYSFAGLQGAFGTVDFGKMNHATRDGGGVYRFFGDIGRLPGLMNSSSGINNTIQYISPSISGFNISVGRGDAGKDAKDDKANDRLDSFGLQGSVAGFRLAAAQETLTDGDSDKVKWSTFAGSYDFGTAKVGAAHVTRKATGGTNESKIKGYTVNLAIPLGNGITAGGSWAKFDNNEAGDATIATLAVEYALSKRTSIFASYQNLKSKGDGVGGTGTFTDAQTSSTAKANALSTRGMGVGEVAGETTSGYGIAIVHKF